MVCVLIAEREICEKQIDLSMHGMLKQSINMVQKILEKEDVNTKFEVYIKELHIISACLQI
jgi:hypothetical protein